MAVMEDTTLLDAFETSDAAEPDSADWFLAGTEPSIQEASHERGASRMFTRSLSCGSLSRASTAPAMHCSHKAPTSQWFCNSFAGSDKASTKAHWKPLGNTWREWEHDPVGTGSMSRESQLRSTADEGRIHMQGAVPHWSKKASLRAKGVLEHEITWAYYRMRRHAEHPLRKNVGDPHLPQTDVVSCMRSGANNGFEFWRDLRPPFHVLTVKARDDASTGHPDGKLFDVTFLCGIDYSAERAWNVKSEAGTFDNKIHSVASVRIPDKFPGQRPLTIVSWGRPILNWRPDDDVEVTTCVPPELWMPIADELGKRPNSKSLAACREASKRAIPKKGIQVPPLQKLLLGPHASLPNLAKVELTRNPKHNEEQERGVTYGGKPAVRNHRIYTACAGFVRYSG